MKKSLNFYDVKKRKKFMSNKYSLTYKMNNGRKVYFAVCNSPSGNKAYRIISKETYNYLK